MSVKSSKHSDIQDMIIPDAILRVFQDKGIEYVDSLEFDNMKEQGIAYGSFVNACKFLYENKNIMGDLNSL